MPFNGAGIYSPPGADFPAVAGTLIEAAHFNNVINDIATALSNCVAKDGQQTITANIPMAGFVFTGMGSGLAARSRSANIGDVQDGTPFWAGTAGGTGDALTLTLSPAITAYAAPQLIYFKASATNTGAATAAVSGLAAKTIQKNGAALAAGDITSGKWYFILYDGTNFQLIATSDAAILKSTLGADGTVVMARAGAPSGSVSVPAVRGALAGVGLANNAGDATNDIDIAVGGAMNSDNSYWLTLASALTKQLDAVWAVGTNQGMRASGAAIANTTYHIFLIGRPDTGVVDIAADTSATGANIAANTNAAYTKIRRIGSILREAGAIVAFSQNGDEFLRSVVAADISATNPGTAAVTRTLSVPVGIKVYALLNCSVTDNSGTQSDMRAVISSLDQSDQASGIGVTTQGVLIAPAVTNILDASVCQIRTNTSAQVRSRLSASGANTTLSMGTFGWIDTRGRFD